MKEKYKFMFLRQLYYKLDLGDLERKLLSNGILPIDIELIDKDRLWHRISNYFSLENNVYENQLPDEMKKKYNYYFSLDINKLCSEELNDEISEFLIQTYDLMLFPNIKENHIFYGPINFNYIAPRDAIVLGFNYKEFSESDENFDETYSKNDSLICDVLNFIQEELSLKFGLKIAVLKYNEFFQREKTK